VETKEESGPDINKLSRHNTAQIALKQQMRPNLLVFQQLVSTVSLSSRAEIFFAINIIFLTGKEESIELLKSMITYLYII
jgi:hypothetical protein